MLKFNRKDKMCANFYQYLFSLMNAVVFFELRINFIKLKKIIQIIRNILDKKASGRCAILKKLITLKAVKNCIKSGFKQFVGSRKLFSF